MARVLLITNDFPPRQGGIQSFVHGMATRIEVDHLVVYSSTSVGADNFDAQQPFPVVRADTTMMLPTRSTAKEATRIAKEHGCDTVWFGAAAPLGLLSKTLKDNTKIRHAVALTHGHEAGWAAIPGARSALRRIARHTDTVTYLAEYFGDRFRKTIGDLTHLSRLTFGVDTERFNPHTDTSQIMARFRLAGRRVVICVSRLVPRKGQDNLVKAWPDIKEHAPGAVLLLVGDGPYDTTLRKLIAARQLENDVIIAGPATDAELPAYYAASDVFAMPCRTRRRGLDVEGLGVVYLEAAASGLPVIVGNSGGAPDTVLDGETGYVVDGQEPSALVEVITDLLNDPTRAEAMGAAGRRWMCTQWTWDTCAKQLTTLLSAP